MINIFQMGDYIKNGKTPLLIKNIFSDKREPSCIGKGSFYYYNIMSNLKLIKEKYSLIDIIWK